MQDNRFAQFFALPERYQIVVDAGISLFELRRTRPYDNTQRIMGYWNVRVREYTDQGSFNINHSVRWFTGPQAYIEFLPNKRSICTAMAPDDDLWHNRLMIALNLDSALFTVEKIHTPDGIIPGAAALQQCKIIRDYVLEWKALDATQVVFRSRTRVGIDAFAQDFKKKNGRDVEIVLGKTESIERLISAYGGRWMEAAEFQTSIRPKIADAIADAQKSLPVSMSQLGQNVLTQVAQMPDEHKRELAAMLAPFISSQPTQPTTAVPQNPQSPEDVSAMLAEKSVADLRRLAKAKGITPGTMNKAQLVEALVLKYDEERSAETAAQAPAGGVEDPGNPFDAEPTTEEVAA